MKILVLNDYLGASAGGFVAAYNLALECRKQGHEIIFLTTVQEKDEQGQREYEGFPVYAIYTKYPLRFRGLLTIWNPFVFKQFARIVQEVRPDIIHAHIIHTYLSHYVLKIAHDLGVPVVLTAHDAMTFCYMRLREKCSPDGTARHRARFLECLRCQRFRFVPSRNFWLRHYINTCASQVISVSKALQIGLEMNGIQNVLTVHNGIDPAQYRVSETQVKEFREQYALDGKKVILFAGRSSSSKGLADLVQAMPRIQRSAKETRLLILSRRNPYMDNIFRMAKELGIDSSLIHPGWMPKDRIKVAYAASDVCVVPSVQFEPLATVILEAMASKKPVVGTGVGGTAEMIVSEKTGYVVPPHDIATLAEKITYLVQHPSVAKEFGEAGYRRIYTHFHITDQCRQVLEMYARTITNYKDSIYARISGRD
jgi:glycosyltransferase involved in cell wall biosynthesis